MTRFGLHDPNTSRHHILVLMAVVSRLGESVEIPYDELEAVARAGWNIELVNDIAHGVIRINLITAPEDDRERELRGRGRRGLPAPGLEHPGQKDGEASTAPDDV